MTIRKRDKTLTIRLTEAESRAIHGKAVLAGLSLSDYVRTAALERGESLMPVMQAPITIELPHAAPVTRRYLVSSSEGDDAA